MTYDDVDDDVNIDGDNDNDNDNDNDDDPAQAQTEDKLGWIGPNLASLLFFSPPILWTRGFWKWEFCFWWNLNQI